MNDRDSRGASALRPAAVTRPAILRLVATVVTVFGVVGTACPALAEIASGPEVGETIPAISAYDQHGRKRTFDDLRGPEGLLVLFYRTADW